LVLRRIINILNTAGAEAMKKAAAIHLMEDRGRSSVKHTLPVTIEEPFSWPSGR